MAKKKGMVQVYTGDGKGKTTAALGLALRAAGHGQRVVIIQFLKEDARGTGEAAATKLAILPIDLEQYGEDLMGEVTDVKRARVAGRVAEGFARAETLLLKGRLEMLVLDEISHVINQGIVTEAAVVALVAGRPTDVEMVLTGRDMPQSLLDLADLVTEMRNIKHPYDAGITARPGIEY